MSECAIVFLTKITLWSSRKSRCYHDIVKLTMIPTMHLVLRRKRSFGYRLVNRQVTKRRWTALERIYIVIDKDVVPLRSYQLVMFHVPQFAAEKNPVFSSVYAR
ncbi:hypothetical protein MTR_8g069785 [Medicago truncatula]|uniref:Uncharacterized protein n=1 Tax=Medicago truncatula TaxID=3880 RepID=A0A072TS10_MEDTR|nr:hypothetical protein MTR_8g069785 [Medicago truncatula]